MWCSVGTPSGPIFGVTDATEWPARLPNGTIVRFNGFPSKRRAISSEKNEKNLYIVFTSIEDEITNNYTRTKINIYFVELDINII